MAQKRPLCTKRGESLQSSFEEVPGLYLFLLRSRPAFQGVQFDLFLPLVVIVHTHGRLRQGGRQTQSNYLRTNWAYMQPTYESGDETSGDWAIGHEYELRRMHMHEKPKKRAY